MSDAAARALNRGDTDSAVPRCHIASIPLAQGSPKTAAVPPPSFSMRGRPGRDTRHPARPAEARTRASRDLFGGSRI